MPITYSSTATAPQVGLDDDKLAKRIAAWIEGKPITDDTSFDAAIDALTDAQLLTLLRRVVKALVRVRPAGSAPG